MMKHSLKTGLSFGLTSEIITTLGLMVGLNSSTHSDLVVIGGILTIAIADGFLDFINNFYHGLKRDIGPCLLVYRSRYVEIHIRHIKSH